MLPGEYPKDLTEVRITAGLAGFWGRLASIHVFGAMSIAAPCTVLNRET